MTRDEVCEQFQTRIALIARRLKSRLPPHCDLGADDLAAQGAIGLLEAFERYEPAQGVAFKTFAEFRIRGAMMDALRSQDSFTRYRRQAANRLEDAVAALTTEQGRAPTPEEVAGHLGIEVDEYWKVREQSAPLSFHPLHKVSDSGEEVPLEETIDDEGSVDALEGLLKSESRDQLREAIQGLSERQRQCILLYYVKDMTLVEIAAVFEVTHSRVSQILTETRTVLRRAIQERTRLPERRYA